MATLPMDMIKPTIAMNEFGNFNEHDEAFSLKLFSNDKEVKKLAKDLNMESIFVTWKQGKCEIGRMMYQKFPYKVYSFVSKQHCIINCRREKVKKNSNNLDFGPTLNINVKNSSSRSNSRERISKSKVLTK